MNRTLATIRNILLWAFFINYALIIVAWLLFLTGTYDYLMTCFFNISRLQTAIIMAYVVAFWKITAIALFLIPALAVHIEYRRTRNIK